jgi:CheY-like chemotaxis protein
MEATPHVLIGLRAGDWSDRLSVWVRGLGYAVEVAADGASALARVRTRPYAASLLESGLEATESGTVWRVVHQIVGRRLVLMAWERRNDLWFEALRAGVGAMLPLPPEEPMVRAALAAATGRGTPGAAPRTG